MKYRTSKVESYDFLAAGSVLYSAPGIPNFPVRLGNEIFNRCLGHYGTGNSIRLYDPCCGGGYLLTTIALLNGKSISHIFASDIDTRALKWARKNLSLLSMDGINARKRQLTELFQTYGKDSHRSSLLHIERLMSLVTDDDFDISVECFQYDILNNSGSFTSETDIIITDVPYGNLVQWSQESGIDKMLEQLKKTMHKDSIIAIIHDKYQKRTNQDYKRLEKFKVGKRVTEILKLK
ncbi:MAG: hypothetical protein HKN68_04170 [Saprospiraceae bacterium]|nr:hypothetical protein [Saprospiraceae bacterium]